MLQISEIVPDIRLGLVGPLPPGLEKTTIIAAGIMTNSAHPEASRALIRFLTSRAAVSVIVAKGMEPYVTSSRLLRTRFPSLTGECFELDNGS